MQETAQTKTPAHHTKNGFENIYPFELKGIIELLLMADVTKKIF